MRPFLLFFARYACAFGGEKSLYIILPLVRYLSSRLLLVANMSEHTCTYCGRSFANRQNLVRHQKKPCKRREPKQTFFKCDDCGKTFTRKYAMQQHKKHAHGDQQSFLCGLCSRVFATRGAVLRHRLDKHSKSSTFVKVKSAHGKTCETFRLNLSDQNPARFSECVDHALGQTRQLLRRILQEQRLIKVAVNMSLRFAKPTEEVDDEGGQGGQQQQRQPVVGAEEIDILTYNFRPNAEQLMFGDDQTNSARLAKMFTSITERFHDFQYRGSGWNLAECGYLEVSIGQCLSMQGSCSVHSIQHMPDGSLKVLPDRKEDECLGNRCFYHALASFLLTKEKTDRLIEDPSRHSVVELEEYLALNVKEPVPAPVPLKKVRAIEEANSHLDLAINVLYSADDGLVYPAVASKKIHARNQLVLLLFHKAEEAESADRGSDYGDSSSLPLSLQATMHYAPLYNPGRVFAKRFSGSSARSSVVYTKPQHFCFNCFTRFDSTEGLENHVTWCHTHEGQVYQVPNKGATIKFQEQRKSFKLGYLFFWDFETYQVSSSLFIFTFHRLLLTA